MASFCILDNFMIVEQTVFSSIFNMSNQTQYQNQAKPVKHQTLLVVDAAVEDYQNLLPGVAPGTEILILHPKQDGVAQMTTVLSQRRNFSSLQIVSHGSAGSLQLGSTQLRLENLETYRPWLRLWRKALSAGGNILLYGCNVAAGEKGVAFVEKLSQLTGAEIAASTNLTGSAARGGDWELEFTTGKIETPLAVSAAVRETYAGVLGFGNGGHVIVDLGSEDVGYSVVIEPDGKIVVAGTSGFHFALTRYNIDGSLDTSFGSDGQVITDLGGLASGHSLAIQPDGKIIVTGMNNFNFALTRYNSDGSLDPSFGSEGKVITDLGGNEGSDSVALQPDGKIVVAGVSSGNFAIVRYNSDGSLDPSFGSEGKVIIDFGSNESGGNIAIQPDGKIVMAGESAGNFAISRYNSDGSLDSSFGTEGKLTTDLGGQDYGLGIVLQPDGKILVAGESADNFALVRYNSDGSLDTSFGTGGHLTTDLGGDDVGRSVALQPDGKILVVGESDSNFALVRYNSDGSLDTSFGSDGQVITDLGGDDIVRSVAIQPDGKIVVAGESDGDFALARYNCDGSLDA